MRWPNSVQWKRYLSLIHIYIATRERVEIIPDGRPPTRKQEQLIQKLVKDLPDTKELFEYEDYLSHPTKATASPLITLTLESNWVRVKGMEGYAKYIALRPRAEPVSYTHLDVYKRQALFWAAPCSAITCP